MDAREDQRNELRAALLAYRRGEWDAFRRVYDATWRVLLLRLRRRVGDPETAEELLQETYMRVHRFVASYRPEQAGITWLFAIADNVARTHVARRRTTAPLPADVASPEQPAPSPWEAALAEALAALSPEDQALAHARFHEDLDYPALAARWGISESNARQRVSRLVKKLRAALGGT